MTSCKVGIRLQRQPDGNWEARAKAAAEGELVEAACRSRGYEFGLGAACAAAARAAVEDLERLLVKKAAEQEAAARGRSSTSGRPARRSGSGRGAAAPGARRLSAGFRR